MKRKLSLWLVFSVLILSVTTTTQAVLKDQINISGSLVDSIGDPITGAKNYQVRFYDAETSGNLIGSALVGSVTITIDGSFNIPIVPPTGIENTSDAWYELAIDTDENGIDSNDIFPDRVAVHSVPYALNSGQLDGQDGSYYLDAANLTGTIPSGNLSLTDSNIPDDITITEADTLATVVARGASTTEALTIGKVGIGQTGTRINSDIKVEIL